MQVDLDDLETLRRLDPGDMLGRIAELPQQCRDAWALARAFDLPAEYRAVRHVVVAGMGGSAIGGALVAGLVANEAAVPMSVVRDYRLPAFIGSETLVVACSYSGNTEETLSAARQAREKGTRLLAITTGGQLAQLARSWDVPVLTFEYVAQPRAALGYSFVLLLGVLDKLGLFPSKEKDLAEATQVMEALQEEIGPQVPAEGNLAKALARRLHGRFVVVYGSGFMEPVANRWKTQVNENSKAWATFEGLPELNHNSVVGYEHPEELRDKLMVVMLTSALDHPRTAIRFRVTREILDERGIPNATVSARGDSRLAQMLSTIHFGDYVSYYLAALNGVDPSPVKVIDFLKRRLAEA